MNRVQPLSQDQIETVIARTVDFIRRAEQIFHRKFEVIPVYFNLKGRAAGMYRLTRNLAEIRYNPMIFSKFFDDNLKVTVPHEVAHYITDLVYGLKNIRPHGKEWKNLMARFEADASRTCNYDLSGIPLRTTRRHVYRCECKTYELSSVRHNRVQRGDARYFCKVCHKELLRSL